MIRDSHPMPMDILRWLASRDLPPDIDWQPLPGGRTNPVWRGQSDGADLVVKLAGAGPDTPLFPNSATAEWAALGALLPSGLAPVPLACRACAHSFALLYQHVPAATAGAEDLPATLHALARLHGWSPWPGLSRRPMAADAIIAETRRWAQADAPPPPDTPTDLPGLPPVPIHRDPVPGNIVITDHGAVLIDWQCPALGDPVEDLVHLTSPMMRIVYGRAPLTDAQRAAVIARYPDPVVRARHAVLAPIYHWRLACYGLWQGARGQSDYTPGIAAELALSGINR